MKKILIGVFAFGIFLAGAKNSNALVPLQPINPGIDLSVMAKIIKAQKKCETFKGKIDGKVDKFNSIHDDHIYNFNLLKYKLETLISKLDDAGYNTMELRSDRDILEGKIDELDNLHGLLIKYLSEGKNADCENNWDKPKPFLVEVRSLINSVKDKSNEIKKFYKNEIRPDIKDLKDETPSN